MFLWSSSSSWSKQLRRGLKKMYFHLSCQSIFLNIEVNLLRESIYIKFKIFVQCFQKYKNWFYLLTIYNNLWSLFFLVYTNLQINHSNEFFTSYTNNFFVQCNQFLSFYSVQPVISNTVFTFLQCIQWHQTLFLQLTKDKQFRVT